MDQCIEIGRIKYDLLEFLRCQKFLQLKNIEIYELAEELEQKIDIGRRDAGSHALPPVAKNLLDQLEHWDHHLVVKLVLLDHGFRVDNL